MGDRAAGAQQQTNLYRVGECVYFENSAVSCFAIRKIDELYKTATGSVEAKVVCFYRRSEVPRALLAQYDSLTETNHDFDSDDEDMVAEREEQQLLKYREVFLSRDQETLPATLIRGKCTVHLMSKVENASNYLGQDDAFFYARIYDSTQKKLNEKDSYTSGNIKIGPSYQASIPALLSDQNADERGQGIRDESGLVFPELEKRMWVSSKAVAVDKNEERNGHEIVIGGCLNRLTDSEIEKFLIIARSVGTLARSLECSSSLKTPSLHMSAAAASRDITLSYAHECLHEHNYDLAAAMRAIVPGKCPMLCKDELESWSAGEAAIFEEAIYKNNKDFDVIKQDALPWKSMRSIIEYFFMWKTTDRYVQLKRIRAQESENKLKQVFVPSYNNKTTRLTGPNGEIVLRARECEAFPDATKYSWTHYKKYNKFVLATSLDDSFILENRVTQSSSQRLAGSRPGIIVKPSAAAFLAARTLAGKTRSTFFLRTTPLTRASRRICMSAIKLTRLAKKPTMLIEYKAIKTETLAKAASLGSSKIKEYNTFRVRQRVNMETVVQRLGLKDLSPQEWLNLTPRDELPKPESEAFPRPPKRPDGSYIYTCVPPTAQALKASAEQRQVAPQSQLFKKRQYQEKMIGEPPTKISRTHSGIDGVSGSFPKRIATMTRMSGGQRHVISWTDAPDEVFYKATKSIKKVRKGLPPSTIRNAARKPFRLISTPTTIV